MSKAEAKTIHKGESSSHYRLCVSPCSSYTKLRAGIHSLCVVCLGAKHAESALDCERLPLHTLRSPKALYEEGDFTGVPRGASPAFAEAEQRLHPWESQMDQVEGMKTGESPSSSFPIRSSARSLGSEARPVVSSPRREGSMLRLSSSEEVDVEDVDELS